MNTDECEIFLVGILTPAKGKSIWSLSAFIRVHLRLILPRFRSVSHHL
jgi:hypothetical protein